MEISAKEQVWGEINEDIVRSALHELDHRLRNKLGASYSHLILFGSRARGDHKPDSDADVAVVMHGEVKDEWALTRSVLEETYELLLDSGLFIEPWIIEDTALRLPHDAANPLLVRNILKDGRMP